MRRNAFTIIELLVVISIIALLISLMLPGFAHARENARYIKWQGLSHNIRVDTGLKVYFNFEQQADGERVGFSTSPQARVINRAAIDALQNAKKRLESKDFDGKGYVPMSAWDFEHCRWRGKGGLRFDGVNNYVALNQSYGTASLREITVYVSLRTNSTADQVAASFVPSKLGQLDANFAGRVRWLTQASSANILQGPAGSPVADDKWHVLVGTYSDLDAVKKAVYMDGKAIATSAAPHGAEKLGGPGLPDIGFGCLGAESGAGAFDGPAMGGFFNGIIDEFIIFERSMAADEVLEYYKVGAARAPK